MYRIVCLFLLFFSANAREFVCPPGASATTASKLRSDVLCDYDYSIRPVKDHRNVTTVSFRLLLKYFSYDHFSHTLSVDAWFPASWSDHHLTWKPEDYEGIDTIHLSSMYELWIPDISVYNRKDQSTEPKVIGDTMCTVNYKGTVRCVPPIHFDALCVPDLKRYPYDIQKCVIRFGSWVQKGDAIDLKLVKPIIDTEDMGSDGEWELLSVKGIRNRGNYSCCPNSTFPSVDVFLEIKRHSNFHTINVVLPLLICILLTITIMAMSPLNKDRLILAYINLIANILHVQNLSYTLPMSGEEIPNLLRISRDSSLLAGVSIIATIFLKSLMRSNIPSPAWMSGTVSILISSRPGQLILLHDSSLKGAAEAEHEEDGATIIDNSHPPSKNASGDWEIFGKFLDVLLFIIYIITYFILIISF